MVGVRGFEPPASASRKVASRIRTDPECKECLVRRLAVLRRTWAVGSVRGAVAGLGTHSAFGSLVVKEQMCDANRMLRVHVMRRQ